jgi:cytochrome oxidase Cu insertion factor (SCO1/SenC/PrrC family)
MKLRNSLPLVFLLSVLIMTSAFDNANSADENRKGRGRRSKADRADTAPKVGEVAPLFTLESQDSKAKTTLADLIGKKPVVLFFGSYT